jgi:small subunit ribosomal protein S1
MCATAAKAPATAKSQGGGVDLSSLTSMLSARWKTGTPSAGSGPEPLSMGQIRSFRIVTLDGETEKIELELI